MKKFNFIHPFLFAAYPILFLFAHNQKEILPNVIVSPVLLSLGATACLVFLFNFIFKNIYKSALYITIIVLAFFNYGYLKDLFPVDFNLNILYWKIGSDKLLFFILAIFLSGAFIFILRLKSDLLNTTKVLNIISLLLISFSLFKIIPYELQTKRLLGLPNQSFHIDGFSSEPFAKKENTPDIYYLIFDRYAASSTLLSELGFDNSEFTDYLENKGFYIADKSFANYPKTFESLASSLNMTHLNFLTEEVGKNSSDQTIVNRMLKNHAVGSFLKEHGYTYYHLGSYWQPTRKNEQADVNISWSYLNMNEFTEMLLQKTPIYTIIAKKKALNYGDENSLRVEQKLSIPFMIKNLKNIIKKKNPKFIFAHFLLPHGPYVFNSDGEPIREDEAAKIGEKQGYLGQLQYANKVIADLIEYILSNTKEKPIIIIQSDEGPCGFVKELSSGDGWGHCGEKSDWTVLSDKTLKIKMRILNAYYLPGVNTNKVLYKNITPVNTFRIIFNQYFGTNYKLLPDKSYIFKDLKHPYDFIEVTERVDYD